MANMCNQPLSSLANPTIFKKIKKTGSPGPGIVVPLFYLHQERTNAMRYDFTSIPDRSNCGSSKWESMKRLNPNVGPEILPMSVADMEFMTAPEIREGLKTYIDTVIQGYTGPTQAYFDAVLDWQRRRHGYEGKAEWIVTTSGVVTAIFSLVTALTQPGDGIIIQRPVYYPFSMAARLTGRKLVDNPLIEREGTYEIDFQDLEAKTRDPRNKVLIFCNPHNPIGKVWSKEDIRRLVDICVKNDVFIIDDEIHNDLILPGHVHTPLPTVCPEASLHCAYCTAPSKTFNLAGMQLSNIFIADPVVRGKVQFQKMLNMSMSQVAISYEACRLAYNEAEPWLEELLTVIDGNARYMKDFLAEHIPEARVYPLEGTYLLWVDFRGLGLTHPEQEALNLSADLYLDEGYLFGKAGRGFARYNLALPRSALEKAMERLAAAWNARKALPQAEHITLEPGMALPEFPCDTADRENVSIRDLLDGKPAVLVFHRYLSCPLCADFMGKLEGGRVLLVVQSTREAVQAAGDLPCTVICDPDRKLYDRFNVFPADSAYDLAGDRTAEFLPQILGGMENTEGLAQQLPAWFALDEGGIITRAHYSEDVFDLPTPDMIRRLCE